MPTCCVSGERAAPALGNCSLPMATVCCPGEALSSSSSSSSRWVDQATGAEQTLHEQLVLRARHCNLPFGAAKAYVGGENQVRCWVGHLLSQAGWDRCVTLACSAGVRGRGRGRGGRGRAPGGSASGRGRYVQLIACLAAHAAVDSVEVACMAGLRRLLHASQVTRAVLLDCQSQRVPARFQLAHTAGISWILKMFCIACRSASASCVGPVGPV